jgi:anthranilate synthase/aminodeoxychorismate synthase-like glutamine amidotransferase
VIALVDNYDSFTWNLAHRLGELGAEVRVVRNDAVSVDELEAWQPSHVVISPGPGRPEHAGISIAVIRRFAGRVPVLGVCLGHQALAAAFGGRVVRGSAPVHGKTSRLRHEAAHLFAGLGEGLEVGRYHSLVIPADGVPEGFQPTAWTEDDDVIMAVRHVSEPVFGVQFHPESVLTPAGHRILQNFLESR